MTNSTQSQKRYETIKEGTRFVFPPLFIRSRFNRHYCISILRTVFGCRRFFEINKLDEARCFILNLGLHPEFDKKTDRSINLCFIET